MAIETLNKTSEFGNYDSFAGSDITAVIGNTMLGTLQAISYSITREKGPIYTMRQSADPLAFARGKRAVAGSLVFITLDEQSLMKHVKDAGKNTFYGSKSDVRYDVDEVANLEALFDDTDVSISSGYNSSLHSKEELDAWYTDQLLPFNIDIIAANERGNGMKKMVVGCEVLNEGSGVSVDDLVIEESYTFVARYVTRWASVLTNS